LHQDAIHVVAGVELGHQLEQFFGGDAVWRGEPPTRQAELFAGGDFVFNVYLRRRVIADEHRGEARADAPGAQFFNLRHEFGVNLVANGVAVEDAGGQMRCSPLILVFRNQLTSLFEPPLSDILAYALWAFAQLAADVELESSVLASCRMWVSFALTRP